MSLKHIAQSGRQTFAAVYTIKTVLKQGKVSTPLTLVFSLDYAIRGIQVNQDGLKLNGTHQLLVHADNVNIMRESVYTVKKKKYNH